jgi:hypothetical protein
MDEGGAHANVLWPATRNLVPDLQRTARRQDDSCVAAKSIRAARAFRTLKTWPRRSGGTTCAIEGAIEGALDRAIRAPAFMCKPHSTPICTIQQ